MSTNEPPVEPPTPPTPPTPPSGGEPPVGGGYGAPPPPYGTGGYGAPPAPDPNAWELGAALSYGWKKFQENAVQLILAGLVVFVGVGVAYAIGFVVMGILTSDPECRFSTETLATTCDDGSGWIVAMIAGAIIAALVFLAISVIGAGLIRGALGITEGKSFQVGEVFKLDKVGPVIVTSLLIAAGVFVGYLLCFLPGIAFAIASSYSLYFVIDKGMAPVEAIKASITLVKDNLGNALIWAIVGYLVAGAGAIACGVGVLVTYPLVMIGTAYTYKKLTAQPVAA
jgi:uncharacterized membrane protein